MTKLHPRTGPSATTFVRRHINSAHTKYGYLTLTAATLKQCDQTVIWFYGYPFCIIWRGLSLWPHDAQHCSNGEKWVLNISRLTFGHSGHSAANGHSAWLADDVWIWIIRRYKHKPFFGSVSVGNDTSMQVGDIKTPIMPSNRMHFKFQAHTFTIFEIAIEIEKWNAMCR